MDSSLFLTGLSRGKHKFSLGYLDNAVSTIYRWGGKNN